MSRPLFYSNVSGGSHEKVGVVNGNNSNGKHFADGKSNIQTIDSLFSSGKLNGLVFKQTTSGSDDDAIKSALSNASNESNSNNSDSNNMPDVKNMSSKELMSLIKNMIANISKQFE